MKIFFIEHTENGLLLTDFENDYKIDENFDIELKEDYNSKKYLYQLEGHNIEEIIDSASDAGFRVIDDPKNRSRARYAFGREIARQRKEMGISQKDLADKSGMKVANLISIELGRYAITFDNLHNIAKALGKNIGFID